MTVVQSIILGIIEGLTEFLPVSSTGHMIIASSVMGIASDEFTKTFTVAIQLGAILSVVLLYLKRFFQTFSFYLKLLVGFIPAAIVGFLLGDKIDALLENVTVVGWTLLLGGVFLLFVDKLFKDETHASSGVSTAGHEISFLKAFGVGMFQLIALVPGVSRSAATIIGGMAQKMTRKAAAEFSFFLAVPTMTAATGYKLLKYYKMGGSFNSENINLLLIGNVVAFLVAMIAIRTFINFLTKYGFRVFGIYRIILGAAILILQYMGYGLQII